tara:strand:- start:627 stop:1067 length:441 start_codon:yes stop_codon:yes gene_type:complete
MATLTPTLTLASTDIFVDQPLNLTVTDSLTVQAPMTDISKMATNDDIGNGAGIIIPESTDVHYVYIKHTGILASDGTTACNSTTDYVLLGDADGTAGMKIRLYPGEFSFFALDAGDGSEGSGGDSGLKITAASANVQVNYAFYKRS